MATTDNRRRTRLVALIAVFALGLGACSSDDDEGSSAATTAAPADVDPDGILHVGLDLLTQTNVGPTFDPAVANQSNGNPNDGLWYMVYGRLMRPDDDGTLIPELAQSATVVDDNTIEIVVRDGVTFSDGTPFDAEAVKWSLDRALASRATAETGFQPEFYSLSETEVTAPNTVTLSFSDGSAPSWYDKYMPGWQTSVTKPGHTDYSNPIGAGPMEVVSYQPGASLVLTKNDAYYNADAIEVAGVEFVHVLSDQSASGLAAVQTGQLDITPGEPPQLANLSGSLASFTIVKPEQTVGMHICKADAPLSDARVRQAINKGIDREALSEAVYEGAAEPQTQIWPPGHRFNSPDLDDTLAHDPEGARELLAEAGYPDGLEVDLHSLPHFGLSEVSEVFLEQMAEIGISVNYVAGGDYLNDFLVPNKRAIGFYPGSNGGLEALAAWSGDGLGNVCDYSNPELDGLVEELQSVSESDPEAVDLWHQVNELVVDEALGGFVLYRPGIVVYDEARVAGVDVWPRGAHLLPDLNSIYVKAD